MINAHFSFLFFISKYNRGIALHRPIIEYVLVHCKLIPGIIDNIYVMKHIKKITFNIFFILYYKMPYNIQNYMVLNELAHNQEHKYMKLYTFHSVQVYP